MVNKRIFNVDSDTGEILEGITMFVPTSSPKISRFGDRWFQMAQDALSYLAAHHKDLGKEGYAVFCKMVSQLDFENYIMINQAELAREIGMQRSNFSRGLRRLIEIGVIIEGPKTGVMKTFQLNPNVGWKGNVKKHATAIERAQKMGLKVIESDPDQMDLIDFIGKK